MKHTDETLQAAIDAAMIEIGNNHFRTDLNFIKDSTYWGAEPRSRLALAKAFLAKLPEPQPIIADDGRSLGQLVHDILAKGFSWDRLLKGDQELCESAAQAVASVVLAQSIRRMEAVPVEEVAEIIRRKWLDRGGWIEPAAQAVRARLIAAARGEAVGINGLTEAEEAKTASVAGLSKPAPSTFKARGYTWMRHTPGDPMPCDGGKKVFCISNSPDCYRGAMDAERWSWGVEEISIIGWRYADEPDITDWKSRSEKAQAELAALKSSQLGIIRPLAEAGPVPDGCVRVTGYQYIDQNWMVASFQPDNDTHFADIRLPVTETPEQTVNEQPKQQVPLGPEDVMPGSIVTNSANAWYKVKYVTAGGIRIDTQGSSLIDYEELKTNGWSINTSLAFGRWDANAWQPCYKLI